MPGFGGRPGKKGRGCVTGTPDTRKSTEMTANFAAKRRKEMPTYGKIALLPTMIRNVVMKCWTKTGRRGKSPTE
jgi:hypothetical protein